MIDEIKAKLSRTSFYIFLFVFLSFYVVGFVYASMFAIFYKHDIYADFVVFTIEHYYTIFIVIMILPFVCGLFIAGLTSPYLTFEQEGEIFGFAMAGGFLYVVVVGIFFLYTIDKDSYITKEQRDIIVDLVKQEKVSKQSVRARFYNDWVKKEGGGREIGKVMDINRVPLEFYVCFEKGFNSPICAKLFENFLIKEKEKVRLEKAKESLAEKNKKEAIENYNRIIEKIE